MVSNDEEKMRKLVSLCEQMPGAGIVYTRSRQKTEELAMLLRRHGVKAACYHAGMEMEERARVQEEFMDGRWRVVCATVAFGMGIDKSDVRFVIHYSLPQSLEDYYQEAGQGGAGWTALAMYPDVFIFGQGLRDQVDARGARGCRGTPPVLRNDPRSHARVAVRGR